MLAAVLLTLGPLADAQEHCGPADTRATCLAVIQKWIDEQDGGQRDAFEQTAKDAAAASAERRSAVALKNTGDGTTGVAGSPSATNDFLPLLRALVGTAGGIENTDGGGFGLEWSNPLGLPNRHQNKLAVTLQRSDVYEPLRDALRAASQADQIDALQQQIDEGDDIGIAFSYARASQRYGRDPDLHEKLYSSLLHLANIPDEEAAAARQRRVDMERSLGLPLQAPGKFEDIFKRPELAGRPDRATLQADYIQAVEEEFLAQFESMAALQQRLTKVGFYGLHSLVNNQPQLSFTANYRVRDDAVGPDEFKAVISYEMGWYNVNTFRDETRDCRENEALCLAGYLAREDVIRGLNQSPRISFNAEYSRRARLEISIPDVAFSYVEAPQEELKISANYARYLGPENSQRIRPRFDASLAYEDFSDDPVRQNRGLATATLTLPVAQGLYLSLGAVYATKPEFRGDVDSELSARAGLVYKLLSGE